MVLCVLWSLAAKSADLDHALAAAEVGWAGNESQVFTASMLTALRFISLTVALAAGSVRETGLGSSFNIMVLQNAYQMTPKTT